MRRAMLVGVPAVAILAMTLVPASWSPGSDGRAAVPARPSPTAVSESPPTSPPGSTDEPVASPTTPPTATPFPPTPDCTPEIPLVDPEATPEARCLAARLDTWRAERRYGVGQQINVSSAAYLDPVETLAPSRPAVVGFDLTELAQGEGYEFAVPPLQALLGLNAEGVLLTASWHTPNPQSGLDSGDRRWQELGELLDPTGSRASQTFWADYDAKLELFRRLQTGDDGGHPPAAVLFRPLHEANGDWFWWAQGTDPADYRALYAALQQRAWDAGVHNIVWAWSPNAVTNDYIADPMALRPDRIDLGGIDSYESMRDQAEQDAQLDLTGLQQVSDSVARIAVTEAGPHGSTDGAWDPTVIPRSATALGLRPVYVMLWFDDGDGADGYSGAKQIGSLRGGRSWLSDCPEGVCSL